MGLGAFRLSLARTPQQPALIGLTAFTDRLYLASYIYPPTQETIFPYPEPQEPVVLPRRAGGKARTSPAKPAPRPYRQPIYMHIDDTLIYNAFFHDFGPLHIGHTYRWALYFHELLSETKLEETPVVLWSKADPKSMHQSLLFFSPLPPQPSGRMMGIAC
jgi:cell division cycle 14